MEYTKSRGLMAVSEQLLFCTVRFAHNPVFSTVASTQIEEAGGAGDGFGEAAGFDGFGEGLDPDSGFGEGLDPDPGFGEGLAVAGGLGDGFVGPGLDPGGAGLDPGVTGGSGVFCASPTGSIVEPSGSSGFSSVHRVVF